MKPKIVIEKVYEEEVTKFDIPVYLLGFDPFSNQNFKGKFVLSNGRLEPKAIQTQRNEMLHPIFFTHAVAILRPFQEQYRNKK